MQSSYPPSFVRDMGCTPREWLQWLPEAIGNHRWSLEHERAQVQLDGAARLTLNWRVLPPRVIALMRMPRLEVSFDFEHTTEEQRYTFMKRFDLYMQRGGG